ncbi:hypothetical protein [Paenibacillus sp.]|nr:hypothetical protein [Paenibacillus sp.]
MSPKLEYPLTSDQLEQAAIDKEKQTVILNEHEQVHKIQPSPGFL